MRNLFAVLLCLPLSLISQEDVDYRFAPVVVVATRYEKPHSELNRSITVLESDDIKAFGSRSITDILSYIGSVDIQRRGHFGIQAEAGIRGASYESTLILIDGTKVNDPQTAHHNMDIPVSIENIERIEILYGSGSAMYGADAVGGIINIVTKSATGLSAHISSGQYGLKNGAFSAGHSLGGWKNSFSASVRQSDGFTDYTDFKTLNLGYQSQFRFLKQQIRYFNGWVDKKFGANSFYSNLFPNEREHTRTFFSKIETIGRAGAFQWSPRVSFRRHDDDFILDNARPNWYRNKHVTRTLGFELPLSFDFDFGRSLLTFETNLQEIKSSSLGNHNRSLVGLAFSQNLTLGRWNYSLEAYANYYDQWGWKLWPALNLGYHAGTHRLFVFWGKSFRIPSFTELYYKSPANMGNPNLTFSQNVSYEIGHNINWKNGMSRLALFMHRGENQIDWSRFDNMSPWQVGNVATTRFTGIDGELRFYPNSVLNIRSVFLSGIYMWGKKLANDFEYKYGLNYLKYSFSTNIENNLLFGFGSVVSMQWKKRINSNPYFLLHFSVHKSFVKWKVYCKASNLLNSNYHEIPHVPQPGRWIVFGLETHIN